MSEELKPCPFCGGEARWVEEHDRIGEPFGLVVDHGERCFIGSVMMADWDAITAAWNTRPKADGLVEELEHLLDRDRYIVAIALGHIRKALDGHRWLLEGRGPYEWDDDRYREEFTAWLEDVEASTGLLAKLAWDKGGCTTDAVKVQEARKAARMYAVNTPVGHRTMLPSDIGLPCPSCAALKGRDVVLEEAAERAAFVAGYRAAHMVPDAYDSTSAAEEAWEGYRLVSRNLKERV